MIRNKKAESQRLQLPAELAREKEIVSSLYNPFGEQTEEYISSAKSLNVKLAAAGFTSILMVEK